MRTIPARQLLDLIEKPYTEAQRGAFAYLRHTSVASKQPQNQPPTAQARFIRDWEDYPALGHADQYNHPGARPTQLGSWKPAGPNGGSYTPPSLTQSDLMWLDRVPRDPSQVSFEDAQHIASLAHSIPQGLGKSPDARLIQAVWAPIKDYHDRKAADIAITNASRRQAPIPSSAIAAVAAAYRNEYDQLTDDECLTRAAADVEAAIGRREAQQRLELDDAQAMITAIDDRASARNEVVRA